MAPKLKIYSSNGVRHSKNKIRTWKISTHSSKLKDRTAARPISKYIGPSIIRSTRIV